MASFTEQATLKVVDQSSGQIRKINAELRKLFATAKSLKSIKVDINIGGLAKATSDARRLTSELNKLKSVRATPKVDVAGLAKATSEVHKLTAEVNRLKSARVNLNVNASGINQVQSRIAALRASAGRGITLNTLAGGYVGAAAARGAYRATKEGTQDVDVGRMTIEMLQLGKGGYEGRRQEADKAIDRVMRTLESMPGPQQFNRGLVSQRFAESLLQVREGEAAEALRIPLVPGKPWLGTRAATAEERKTESIRRMNQAQLRTEEELNIADIIAKRTPGMDPRQAIGKVAGYFKAMDQAGWLTDDAGNFDPQGLQKAGTFVRRMIGMVGEEATGRFMHTLFKREKGAKFSLNERGQLMAAIVAEDMDPATAGTALSSWMRQTQGQGITKNAMAARMAAGMVDPIYGKNAKGKRVITGYKAKGAELAMTDPLEYAKQVLIPGLQKMGITMEEIYSGDEKDIAKVKGALDKLHSNVNAAQFAQILITKGDEINKQIIDAYTRDASQAASREASQLSVGAAFNAITGQFKGMMGEAVVAIAPAIGYVSQGVSTFFKENADLIRKAGEGDAMAIAQVTAMGAGTALVGGAGIWAVKQLLQKTGIGDAIGFTSGMMALASENEAVRALGGAGLALMGAADALKSAAAVLANDPSLGPGMGPPGEPGGKPGQKPGGPTKPGGGRPGIFTRMGTAIAAGAATVASVATSAVKTITAYVVKNPGKILKGTGWLAAGSLAYDFVQSQPGTAASRVQRNENKGRINTLLKQIKTEEAILAQTILRAGATPSDKTKAFIDRQIARLNGMREELDRRQREYESSMFETKPTPVKTTKLGPKDMPQGAIPGSSPILSTGSFTQAVTAGVEAGVQAKPITTVPVTPGAAPTAVIPGATPVVPGGFTKAVTDGVTAKPLTVIPTEPPAGTVTAGATAAVAAVPPAEGLAALIPQLALTSSSINLAVSGLTSAGTTFATVFQTGATAIGTAGQTAASTLQGAAPSIGAAIGSAAAAAISAATANIQVNVNNSAGAPTGSQKAAN